MTHPEDGGPEGNPYLGRDVRCVIRVWDMTHPEEGGPDGGP